MDWRKQYAEMIGCVDVTKIDIDGAMALKDANMPTHLYKYRTVNDYSLDNLRNNTVWVDRPNKFNDTFEFNEKLDIDRLISVISKVKFDELYGKIYRIVPIEDRIKEESKLHDDPIIFIFNHLFETGKMPKEQKEKIFSVLHQLKQEEAKKIMANKNLLMQDQMKVCCFCEDNSVLTMWSYYADSHKGFCIEYDIQGWFPFDIRRRVLYPVIYQEEMFDSTPHLEYYIKNGTFNNLYPLISGSTKSTNYINEKEWRFIFNVGDSFIPRNYPMNTLNRVFLGSKMSDEDKAKVLAICNEKRIDVLQAETELDGYKMKFTPVNF